MTEQTKRGREGACCLVYDAAQQHIAIQPLPNGYWKATIRLPWPDGGPDYVQTADSFHDAQEARDWAEMQVSFLTCTEDCCK